MCLLANCASEQTAEPHITSVHVREKTESERQRWERECGAVEPELQREVAGVKSMSNISCEKFLSS